MPAETAWFEDCETPNDAMQDAVSEGRFQARYAIG
jgi:hypothetical protein